MSQAGTQAAIAALIRNPKSAQGKKFRHYISQFSLTESEAAAVAALAKNSEVKKYGREQAEGRFELMMRSFMRINRVLDESLIYELWQDLFEPQALRVKSDYGGRNEYSLSFLRFLTTDMECRRILHDQDLPLLWDLLAFEIAELELGCAVPSSVELKQGSSLRHSHFRVLDLQFDVPAFIQSGYDVTQSFARKFILLLVREDASIQPRIFHIERSMRDFLLGSLMTEGPHLEVPHMTQEMQGDLHHMHLL